MEFLYLPVRNWGTQALDVATNWTPAGSKEQYATQTWNTKYCTISSKSISSLRPLLNDRAVAADSPVWHPCIITWTDKLISQIHRGEGQCFDCLVNITNEPHVSLSHHLSVRRTLRMLGLALMQLRQKTRVYRPEMLMREWRETWQGGGRGRGVWLSVSPLYNCLIISAAHY